jgi:hypothetical protein
MAAHLYIQIATNRRIKTRARSYARYMRQTCHRGRARINERERFDFLEEIFAPRIELGSSIEQDYPSSWINPMNDLLRKKVLTMINDKLIEEVRPILMKCAKQNDYVIEEAERILKFLTTHKGQRCYVKWW